MEPDTSGDKEAPGRVSPLRFPGRGDQPSTEQPAGGIVTPGSILNLVSEWGAGWKSVP